jgi:PAS domain-containing protein
MQRFVLEQNITHFRALLREKTDEASHRTIGALLAAAERDLAFFDSGAVGVGAGAGVRSSSRCAFTPHPNAVAHFRAAFAQSPTLCLAIDPGPGLHILDMNDAFAAAAVIPRDAMIGQPLFATFPDNPDDPSAAGMSMLYTSLRTASETRKPHAIATYRYDVRSSDGEFLERYWSPVNSPMFDDNDRLMYLLQQVEDVTAQVLTGSRPCRDD